MRPKNELTASTTLPAGYRTGAERSLAPPPEERKRRGRRALLASLATLALAGTAGAQTPLGGSLYDGNGGPLASGTVYHVTSNITVPAGETLTIPDDVIVKFQNGRHFFIDGTLTVTGTASDPVVFTSLYDDDWGGDTNGDGPSTGFKNAWRGLSFSATAGASSLEHAILRWSGDAFYGTLEFTDADVTVTDCSFVDNGQSAIDLNSSSARPTVTGCEFVNNSGYVCTNMPLDAVVGFSGCTASGNGGNHLNVTAPSPTVDLTITADNCVGGALLFVTSAAVPAGVTLTLEEGVVIKMWNGTYHVTVHGTLITSGTPERPVVFTARTDDEFGGDTNGDGPSSGWVNYWAGIILTATAGDSVLEHTTVRYGGYGYYDGITVQGADVTLRGCLLEFNGQDGLGFCGLVSHPRVEWCRFENNGRHAVSDLTIEAVPGFLGNRASGNGMGNYLRITQTSPTEDVRLHPRHAINGVFGFANHTVIPADVTLECAAGTIIKRMQGGGNGFEVHGSMNLLGTAAEPVVITSRKDDSYGGDTNNDGASTGGWIDWSGIKFHADAQTSVLEHAVVRFNGYNYWNAIEVASPNVTLRSVLSEQTYTRGFSISALAGNAENLVARSCQYAGIQATGGAFDIVHATVWSCGTGIESSGSFTGMAKNCISWANTTNYSGFAAGELLCSNGSATHAGTNGCIDLDPQLIDPLNGDYRLPLTSPCIDSADYASALPVVCDHAENSRVLDPNLTGAMLPDMGAFEHALWTMSVRGRPEIGGALRFQVDGPAGTSIYLLGLLDGSVVDTPHGIIGAGSTSLITFATVPVGTKYLLEIPRTPSLVGLPFGVQTRTVSAGNPAVGSITNLHRDAIQPVFRSPRREAK